MVEVNAAYKHGQYEHIWLNSLCVMSKVKVFATQGEWMDSQSNVYRGSNYITKTKP